MHPFLLFLFFKFECVELLDCIAGHCAHPIEEYLQLLETLPDLSVEVLFRVGQVFPEH